MAYSIPTRSHKIKKRLEYKRLVLSSEQVRAAIEETGSTPAMAEKLFQSMAAKESETLLTLLVAIFKRLMYYLFPLGIKVNEQEVERLRKIIEANPNKPIIYLPTHKSHMDYLTVHYVCFIYNLPIPYVVAGENLNIPVIGHILRMCGAFFIRRSFAGDLLYKAVFQEYAKQLLISGQSMECFIEGGRSRSGKLLPPKIGFVQCVVNSVLDGDIDDALIVPMSLGEYSTPLSLSLYIY